MQPFFSFKDCVRITTGLPESQQPTGSQVIRICMEIYVKIDKMVKMYKTAIKVYIPQEELCLCCFLTVSCLINAILASFNVWFFNY